MRSFTYSTHINRPPEAVFDFMMDFGRASSWRNLVRKIEVLTPGPVRKGSELAVTFDVMGKVRTTTSEVWAFERPRRLGLRNTANNVTGVFEYTLEPHDGWPCRSSFAATACGTAISCPTLRRAIEDGWPA